MAAGAGFSVASLYYSQPMLGLIAQDLAAGERAVGLVPTLTQLGYALGILLLAPLGDRFDRRNLILLKSVLLALALGAAALAGQLPGLLVASLLVGLMATLAQDIVPAAAVLAPDAQRGQVVGRVMTGLLLGILLSRVVSGVVAEAWGWRVQFGLAALSVLAMGAVMARALPHFAATSTLRYPALLGSLLALFGGVRHPLRQGLARRVHVARKLHVTAERQPPELPPRATLVCEARDLLAETDREGVRLDPENAPGEIMSHLVHEHEGADHCGERQYC